MKALIDYIESLEITQGEHAGEAFKLLPWQRRFCQRAFKPSVSTAALTIGRGNGKTTFTAAIACAAINGPLAQPRGEVDIVASSFSQAKIAFSHVLAFMRPTIDKNPKEWSVSDSANKAEIRNRKTGIVCKAVASDPRRAHGLAPTLVLADEPSQWVASTSESMRSALATSLGKIPGSRMVALGTKPADDSHWFGKWLAGGADYSQVHAASPDDRFTHRRVWKKANPSLDHMPTLESAIKADCERAKGDDTELQSFKALRLNLGVSDTIKSVVLEANTWRQCETANLPAWQGESVWGVDLGSGSAMSAIANYDPVSYRLEVVAAFPRLPSLEERGKRDSVGTLYERMAERGELIQVGNRTVDVTELVELAYLEWGRPKAVVCDRWRQQELIDALDSADLVDVPVVLRGMGFRDGGEDMRRFRRAAIESKIITSESLLMRSAIAGARTVSDAAGNAKLAKASDSPQRRDHHRDDALAATILAVAEGVRTPIEPPKSKRGYLGLI